MRHERSARPDTNDHRGATTGRRTWLALALWALGGCSGGDMNSSGDMGGGDMSGGGDMGGGGNDDMGGVPPGPGLKLIAGTLGGIGRLDGVGTGARFNQAGRITSDGAGNLYVVDYGPTWALRKIVEATGAVTTVSATTNMNWLAADPAGNVYFSHSVAYQIHKIDVATGQSSIFIDNTANLNKPWGLALDGAGNMYVADSGSSTIRKIDLATKTVTTIAGTAGMTGSMDGRGAAARFNSPFGVAYDAGFLYVSDRLNGTIRKIDLAMNDVTTLAGTALMFGNTDGMGSAARFMEVNDVAADHAGHLFVADGYRVRRIDLANAAVTALAGQLNTPGEQDGAGTASLFNKINSLTVAADGSVLIADVSNIRKVTPMTGVVSAYIGQFARPGLVDGSGSAARFNQPNGAAVWDGAGNLYVPDTGSRAIRKIVLATGQVTTLAGGLSGTADGTGAAARFQAPSGITRDGTGNLYVADYYRVRRVVEATGEVTTLAGGTTGGNVNGIGTAARFNLLSGITHDGAGNLYVGDEANSAIRKIVISTGEVSTLATISAVDLVYDGAGNLIICGGSNLQSVSIATGMRTFVMGSDLNNHRCFGVALDGAGNAYVSFVTGLGTGYAPLSAVIRKVSLSTGIASDVVGVQGQRGVRTGALPGSVNFPFGLHFIPNQGLVIGDYFENVFLLASGI